jgi:CBS domain-containing protein
MPVMDAAGRVTGWITLSDLARAMLHGTRRCNRRCRS